MQKTMLWVMFCALGWMVGCSGSDGGEEPSADTTVEEAHDGVESEEVPEDSGVEPGEEGNGEDAMTDSGGEGESDAEESDEDALADSVGEEEPDAEETEAEDAEGLGGQDATEPQGDTQDESEGDVQEVEDAQEEADVIPVDGGDASLCGELSDVPPVDCTGDGDLDAVCVFQNHCLCSNDFICAEEPEGAEYGNKECEPGVGCIPDPLAGSYGWSCGQASQGLTPVDCGEFGDEKAFCIYSNHCSCSQGFICTDVDEGTGECAPGATCIPVE